jgi:nicotinamide mononucleotide transporter PnuC
MKLKNPFSLFTKFDYVLWAVSAVVVALSFLLSPERDALTLIASVVGVSALIFIAKGHVVGQFLIVAFAVLYGIVSIEFKYYGEAITYLGMSAPIALGSIVSWIRHPYGKTSQVEVHAITWRHVLGISLACVGVTVAFYFILDTLGTQNLIFSTLSVTTSFFAASLSFFRSPFYALAYCANDLVLIVLWVLATVQSISYLPMILCFVMFLINDVHGFLCWRKMQKSQSC